MKRTVELRKTESGFKVVCTETRWSSLSKVYNNTVYSSEELKTIEEAKSLSKNVWGV